MKRSQLRALTCRWYIHFATVRHPSGREAKAWAQIMTSAGGRALWVGTFDRKEATPIGSSREAHRIARQMRAMRKHKKDAEDRPLKDAVVVRVWVKDALAVRPEVHKFAIAMERTLRPDARRVFAGHTITQENQLLDRASLLFADAAEARTREDLGLVLDRGTALALSALAVVNASGALRKAPYGREGTRSR